MLFRVKISLLSCMFLFAEIGALKAFAQEATDISSNEFDLIRSMEAIPSIEEQEVGFKKLLDFYEQLSNLIIEMESSIEFNQRIMCRATPQMLEFKKSQIDKLHQSLGRNFDEICVSANLDGQETLHCFSRDTAVKAIADLEAQLLKAEECFADAQEKNQ